MYQTIIQYSIGLKFYGTIVMFGLKCFEIFDTLKNIPLQSLALQLCSQSLQHGQLHLEHSSSKEHSPIEKQAIEIT